MFQGVVNGGQGIFDWEDKTGGKLLEAPPGVHQCWRIGEKVEPGHALIPALGRMGQPTGRRIPSFSLRDIGRDAPE
jgi:hypothetical protein